MCQFLSIAIDAPAQRQTSSVLLASQWACAFRRLKPLLAHALVRASPSAGFNYYQMNEES